MAHPRAGDVSVALIWGACGGARWAQVYRQNQNQTLTTPRGQFFGFPPQASPPPPLPQSRRGVAFSDGGGGSGVVLDHHLTERVPSADNPASPQKSSLRRAKSGSTGSLVSLVTSWTPWGRDREGEDEEEGEEEGEE